MRRGNNALRNLLVGYNRTLTYSGVEEALESFRLFWLITKDELNCIGSQHMQRRSAAPGDDIWLVPRAR